MKKLFSILLSILLILPLVASFGVTASAGSTYKELWAEKVAYEKDLYIGTGVKDGYFEDSDYSITYDFILYTEKGSQFTYEIAYIDPFFGQISSWGSCLHGYEYVENQEQKVLYCPEIDVNNNWYVHSPRSVIRSLGLTKEEIVLAYQKMIEEPESIRPLLSCLTDIEFEQYMNTVKLQRLYGCPPNFILEAYTMENDEHATQLLCKKAAVYLPEYGETFTTFDLFGDGADSFAADFGGFFEGVDLTTCEFQYYFENLKKLVYVEWPGYDSYMGGSVLPKIAYLEAEVARQLAAKETGDGAVQGITVLALAIPALAATLILRRKKRI
jgi:hypothetical protein